VKLLRSPISTLRSRRSRNCDSTRHTILGPAAASVPPDRRIRHTILRPEIAKQTRLSATGFCLVLCDKFPVRLGLLERTSESRRRICSGPGMAASTHYDPCSAVALIGLYAPQQEGLRPSRAISVASFRVALAHLASCCFLGLSQYGTCPSLSRCRPNGHDAILPGCSRYFQVQEE